MPGAVVIGGKDRMLVEPPVPAVAPPLSVKHADAKSISIAWPRTAGNIGLVAELHRGPTKDFQITEDTIVGDTLIDHYVDDDPDVKDKFYALVLKGEKVTSKPSRIEVK
jgi:hypothetical protein